MQELSEIDHVSLPRLIFDFNGKWEIQNWYIACTKESNYGLRGGSDSWFRDLPEAAVKAAKAASNKEEGVKALLPILNEFIKTPIAQQTIKDSIEHAKQEWGKRENAFFPALSAMLDVPIERFEKEYHAHLTFTRRCPFNKNEFMFSKFGRIENVATHEIMHIEFLKAYEAYCKERGLTDSEVQHLKEILTVLLNEDEIIKNLRSQRESGYTKHEKIREDVAALYKKHKTDGTRFLEFLDEVTSLVKEEKFDKH